MELKADLFKELKAEYSFHQSLVHKLWTYKFAVIGSVLMIAVFNDNIYGIKEEVGFDISSFGLLLLPVLSLLIDFKVLEIGVHLKMISNFIIIKFNEEPVILDWEKYSYHSKISKLRNNMTLITYGGTSLFILIACFLMVVYRNPEWLIALIGSSVFLLTISIIGLIKLYFPLYLDDNSANTK